MLNKSTQIFYVGANELPQSAIAHMEVAYNVKFVDITTFPEAAGINLQGYQLKAFSILLSSFEEVSWLLCIVVDPEFRLGFVARFRQHACG